MKNQDSRLLVIPYYLDNSYLESIRSCSCDILALSLPAIQQLDSEKIRYLTIGNFITQKDYDIHLSKMTKSFTEFLVACDTASKHQFSLERLFSSNGFWFLHRLSHLSFIQILIDKLDEQYDQIEIYSKKRNYVKENIRIDFTKLHFPIDNLTGLDGFVESLIIGLKTKIVH